MLTIKRLIAWTLPSLALLGCATSTITNLTSTQQPRNPTGQYLVEYAWDSNDATIHPDTITPYILIGFEVFKMQPTPKVKNRWETYIPVKANESFVRYRFRVDYEFNQFGKPGKGSKLSPEYKLIVTDN
jgi:hypothetical protein